MNPKVRKLAITITGLTLAACCWAAEKKISQANLPKAVQKTALEQSHGATVKGYSQDRENGKLEYEVEMIVNGHSKDVTIAPDGSLLEVEEQVEMGSLPAAVQAGLNDKARKGSITKIESITKHGSIVAYEAQVKTMNRHSEVQVGPDGKALNHEE